MKRFALVLSALLCLPALAAAQSQQNVPSGDGTALNWIATPGNPRYQTVDDTIGADDGDTTYLSQTFSGQRNDFTFPAFTVPGGSSVTNLQLNAVCKYVGTSSSLRLNIINETPTTNEDSDRAITSSYALYTRTLATNPFTSSAWTVNEVNSDGATSNRFAAMQIRSISPNTDIRCTAVYVTVNYTGGGGATGYLRLSLMGVGP